MHNLQAAKAEIIQKLQETEEAWIIRSIQRLLNIEEMDEDKLFWEQVGLHTLSNAYGADEPDYDHYEVKEPNLDYKS